MILAYTFVLPNAYFNAAFSYDHPVRHPYLLFEFIVLRLKHVDNESSIKRIDYLSCRLVRESDKNLSMPYASALGGTEGAAEDDETSWRSN